MADDHRSLVRWFAAVPNAISSHHILHSTYSEADNGDGLLSMVVAYQAPGPTGIQGSIISYETRIGFAPQAPRFIALDKTPILPNTRAEYETSWSANRTLALVHAELGGIAGSDRSLRAALGDGVRQISVQSTAREGSRAYDALIASTGNAGEIRVLRVAIADDGRAPLPRIERIDTLAHAEPAGTPAA